MITTAGRRKPLTLTGVGRKYLENTPIMIESLLLDTSWPVFLGLTVVLFGGCAFMTGQATALAWRPAGLVPVYGVLLGVGDRFLTHALFQGPLWSLPAAFGHTALLTVLALAAYRFTLARRMVSQYPWLYRRHGLWGWQERTARRV
jgi:hypothetical protein